MTSLNTAPYTDYGSTFSGNSSCGQVTSVDQDGALQNTVQAVNYGPGSGVHGLAVSSNNAVLYSADDSGNAVWTHLIHPEQGNLAPVDRIPGPQSGSDPRHITVHPSGRHTYVLLEGTNKLAEYKINPVTGTLVPTNASYPLVPGGTSNRSP